MAFVEEVYENMDKWYGAHTGKEYEKSQTEKKGACQWSKPAYGAPGEITLEIKDSDQTSPKGNGYGKAY